MGRGGEGKRLELELITCVYTATSCERDLG
jgi:hypothetical protein